VPFPLAHPIAILPLRRWCPRRLSFLGLVVGSIAPDAGYVFRNVDLAGFSHSALGSVLFALPVGLLAVLLVQLVREPLTRTLPGPHRQAVESLNAGPTDAPAMTMPWWRLVLSVLIGVWSHILFDRLTHESDMQARALASLNPTVNAMEETGLRFYQVVWITLSLCSMGVLFIVYLRFLKRVTGRIRLFDRADRGRALLWLTILIAPYLVVVPFTYHVFERHGFRIDKHAIYDSLQPYLLLVTGILVLLGFLLRRPAAAKPPPPT
jgi:hypothetical protein